MDHFGLAAAVHDENFLVWKPSRGGFMPCTNSSTEGLFAVDMDRPFIYLLYNSGQYKGVYCFGAKLLLRTRRHSKDLKLEAIQDDHFDYMVVGASAEERIQVLLRGGSSLRVRAGHSPPIGRVPLAVLSSRSGGPVFTDLTGDNVLAYLPDTGRSRDPRVLRAHGWRAIKRITSAAMPSNAATYSPPFRPHERPEPRGFVELAVSERRQPGM